MKKTGIFFLIILMFYRCSTLKQHEKKEYKERFKTELLCECLKYGFNESKEIKKLLKEDKSLVFDEPFDKKHGVIEELAKLTYQKIRKDSINTIGKVAEGAEGKRVFQQCLKVYNSKKIDSLAILYYKKRNDQRDE